MDTLLRYLIYFSQPLCFAWLLLTVWLAQAAWRRLWRWSLMPALAWLVLSVVTCTPFASVLISQLEDVYPRPTSAELESLDAIIYLGGGAQPSLTEPSGVHIVAAGDRIVTAVSMAASKLAPVLVLGGGGYKHDDGMLSEADALEALLKLQPGIGFEIVSLGICSNTRDEAQKVARLIQERQWKKVLLVTSAYHMPRSVATFAKVGVPVVPMPCNYLSSYNRIGTKSSLHLPHRECLDIFNSWAHEVIGTWVYRWRGWI